MHFTLRALVEMLAQEWYVICAYFGIYVLLEAAPAPKLVEVTA